MKQSNTSEMLVESHTANKINSIMNMILMLFLFGTTFIITNPAYGQNPGTTNNTQWGKNGPASAPVSPVVWENGNAQGTNSHFLEGESISTRIELENMTPGVPATITFGIDMLHGVHHTFDFFTGPNRINEAVQPLDGLAGYGVANKSFQFPIPNAGNTGGVPASYYDETAIKMACLQAFEAGDPTKNSLWIYNGTITSITYIWGDENHVNDVHTHCIVTFTPTAANVLFALGCHIAAEATVNGCTGWGAGQGASAEPGSPYHFHADEVCQPVGTCYSQGEASQQMASSAVCSPPVVEISGDNIICLGESTTLTATATPTDTYSYQWSTVLNDVATDIQNENDPTLTVSPTSTTTYRVKVSTDQNGGCETIKDYVVTVNALPVCSITGSAAICAGASTQWCATEGMTAYAWSTGATTQCITVSQAGTYSVTITNANGCQSICEKTLVVNPLPVCSITGNAYVCTGSSTQWCAPASMTAYAWSTGATTQCITVSEAATYSVTITNANGCKSICEKTLVVNPCGICTYTQGYYGNKNGNSCDADGTSGAPITYQSPVDLLTQLLSSGTLTVGVGGKSITIPINGAAKLNSVMPGNSTPRELTNVANCIITDACFSVYLSKQGRINNVMLSQTIVLGLNMRIAENLPGFILKAGILATAKPNGGCGSTTPMVRSCYYNPEYPYNLIVVNEYMYKTITTSVIDALTNKGYAKTVAGLFALANDALANVDGTIGKEGGASLSDITAAVDAINNAFDGCRLFVGWDVEPCTVELPSGRIAAMVPQAEVVTDKLTVSAYPNPFDENIRFEIKSPVSGQASLEIYNTLGQRMNTVYRGYIKAGKTEYVNYNVPANQRTNLIYILRMGNKQTSGKLINIKH